MSKSRKAAKDPTKFAEAEQRLADLRQRTAFGGLSAESESEESEEDKEDEEEAPLRRLTFLCNLNESSSSIKKVLEEICVA
eukprot:s6837_g2.t1